MSTVVGALAVELGLDTAQFEAGLRKIPGLTSTHMNAMSAEMKRTTREGQEAFRVFDEVIGLHLNRPLTRLIVETFPNFSKAMAEMLGPLAFVAVGFAAFALAASVIDRVTKAVAEAKKKEEEFIQSTHALYMALSNESIKTANDLDTIKEKLAELSGDKGGALAAKLRIISRTDAEEAVRAIDSISDAYAKNAKAAMEAAAWTTNFWNNLHALTTSPLDLATERSVETAKHLKGVFDDMVSSDPLHGLEKGTAFLKSEIAEVKKQNDEMHASELSATSEFLAKVTFLDGIVAKRGAHTREEVALNDALLASLQKQLALAGTLQKVDEGKKTVARKESDSKADIGEKQIEKLKAETDADLALAAAAGQTAAALKLQQASGEADRIISGIIEQAHGRLTTAMKQEILTVHALTAERQVAKDAISTNQELEKQVEVVKRQIESNRELAAAYAEGGVAIEQAKIDQRLSAQIESAKKLRDEYVALKKVADDYAESTKKFGSAGGPKPGLDISTEHLSQLKTAADNADRKVAILRTESLIEDETKYQSEINTTSRALADEQPFLDRLNQAYTENAQAVRHAQVALALFHWEQAHPGQTVEEAKATLANSAATADERTAAQIRLDQISAVNAQLEQQSINQQRSADAQLAARYNISKSYDDEIARLERAREVLQQYGQDTLSIDAAIFDERQRMLKQWDDAALKVGTFGQKYQAVMNELVIQGQEAGRKIAEAFLGAIDSAESDLAKLLTGQKVQPQKIVQNFAEQATKAELQKLTGSIAGAFGIEIKGPEGRPDGTSEKPIHVTMGTDKTAAANPLGNAAAQVDPLFKGISSQMASGGGFFSRIGSSVENFLHAHGQQQQNKDVLRVMVVNAVSAMVLNWPQQMQGAAAFASATGTQANPFYSVTSTPEGTPAGASAGAAGAPGAQGPIGMSAALSGQPSPAYSAFLAKQVGIEGGINWTNPFANVTDTDRIYAASLNTPFGPAASVPFGGPRSIAGNRNIFNSSTDLGSVAKTLNMPGGFGAGIGSSAGLKPDGSTSNPLYVTPVSGGVGVGSTLAVPKTSDTSGAAGTSGASGAAGTPAQALSKAGADLDKAAQPLTKAGDDTDRAAQSLSKTSTDLSKAATDLSAAARALQSSSGPGGAGGAAGAGGIAGLTGAGGAGSDSGLSAIDFGGGLAAGGKTSSGTTYMVGENGPELFRAATAGEIVPNHKLAKAGILPSTSATVSQQSSRDLLSSLTSRDSLSDRASVSRELLDSKASSALGFTDSAEHLDSSTLRDSASLLTDKSSREALSSSNSRESVSDLLFGSRESNNSEHLSASDVTRLSERFNSSTLRELQPFLSQLTGFRAAGGPVSAGANYVVGERGREAFQSGGAVPSNAERFSSLSSRENFSDRASLSRELLDSSRGSDSSSSANDHFNSSTLREVGFGSFLTDKSDREALSSSDSRDRVSDRNSTLRELKNSDLAALQFAHSSDHTDSSTFRELQSLFAQFEGFRAEGGPVRSAASYAVGERGPEAFQSVPSPTNVERFASFGSHDSLSDLASLSRELHDSELSSASRFASFREHFNSSTLKDLAGFRAAGGPVVPGSSYAVGEHGPEAFQAGAAPSSTQGAPYPSIPSGPHNQSWTFDPHAGYAQSYERYERWLHGDQGGSGLWKTLGLLGGELLLKKSGLLQRFESLFHHNQSQAAIAAGLPAQTGVLDELNSLSTNASGSVAGVGPGNPDFFGSGLGADGGAGGAGGFGGFFADGGDVWSGTNYIVGERGPELFRASRAAEIGRTGLLSALFKEIQHLIHPAVSPAAIAGSLPAQTGVLNELNSLTKSASSASSSSAKTFASQSVLPNMTKPGDVDAAYLENWSARPAIPNAGHSVLPNMTKPGDVDAAYLQNWARTYSVPSPSAGPPSTSVGPTPQEPSSFINLPQFPASSDFAITLDGFRAAGGPVHAGSSYMVGERGPEAFRSLSRELISRSLTDSSSAFSRESFQNLMSASASKTSDSGRSDSKASREGMASVLREHFDSSTLKELQPFIHQFQGFRAAGGSVQSGAHYMVGEHGPELFRASQDGHIVPNHMLHLLGKDAMGKDMAAPVMPSISIPDFAGFMADGGDVFAGNSYMVGERGPEAYQVPGLSSVSNSSDSRNMSRRGGDVHHNNITQNNYGNKEGTDLFNRTSHQELTRMLHRSKGQQ